MSNEQLGENVNKKTIEGVGVIKEVGLDHFPRITVPESENPNKELIENKEASDKKIIEKIDNAIDSFEGIRKKYSHENYPDTSDEEKEKLNESRRGDNLDVETLINILEEVMHVYPDSDPVSVKINFYLSEMKNFLKE